jgi:hypothetical protein
MVQEDSLSSRSIFNGWVRGRREAGVNGDSRHEGGTRSFLDSPVLTADFEIEIWVVPREFKLSSHDGREFFAFF